MLRTQMSRRTLLLGIALCALIIALLFAIENKSVSISAFSWNNEGKRVSFAFILKNLTAKQIAVEMTLVAYNVGSMRLTGAGSTYLGTQDLHITLQAHEVRNVAGSFDLNSSPSGSLVITRYLRTIIVVEGRHQ